MDNQRSMPLGKTQFCKHCGAQLPDDSLVCAYCGCRAEIERQAAAQPQLVINHIHTATGPISGQSSSFSQGGYAANPYPGTYAFGNNGRLAVSNAPGKNKWVAFGLCFFLGLFGAHKFYEGKPGKGILYLFTMGLFGIGWLVDCIVLLCKPNPYYVR